MFLLFTQCLRSPIRWELHMDGVSRNFRWTNRTIRAKVEYHPISTKNQAGAPSIRQESTPQTFLWTTLKTGGGEAGKETNSLQTLMKNKRTTRSKFVEKIKQKEFSCRNKELTHGTRGPRRRFFVRNEQKRDTDMFLFQFTFLYMYLHACFYAFLLNCP